MAGAARFAGFTGFTAFTGFTGFTGIARNAEIVIRTKSSVCNPSAFANPGDKSATRPVEIFGPQSTGRASAACRGITSPCHAQAALAARAEAAAAGTDTSRQDR